MINYLKTKPSTNADARLYYRTIVGFTIVELLIVIVVIGILTTVTIVAYTGISKKAVVASLQSDLSNAATKLKLFQVDKTAYPTLINDCPTPAIGNLCLTFSPGNTYGYSVVNTSNPQTFRLTATNTNGTIYVVKNDSLPTTSLPDTIVSQTFSYTGSLQTLTVPANVVSVTIECKGGAFSGRAGGYAKGDLAVSSGDILNINISAPSSYTGSNSSANRPSGPMLLQASAAYYNDSYDYNIGYGYIYAGLTNTSVSNGTNAGVGNIKLTYTILGN